MQVGYCAFISDKPCYEERESSAMSGRQVSRRIGIMLRNLSRDERAALLKELIRDLEELSAERTDGLTKVEK